MGATVAQRRAAPACLLGMLALLVVTPAASAASLRPESRSEAHAAGLFDLDDPGSPPAAPSTSPGPQASAPKTTSRRLSNERTLSRWAYVERSTLARRRPNFKSRRVRRLRTITSDGTPELVLVLRVLHTPGRTWLKVRLPMRPNGRIGWVPRSALGRLHTVRTFMRINRRRFTATLYRRGRRVWRSRLGVGKRGTSTPRGNFYIRNRLVPAERNGIYGIFAFGTSAYSRTLSDWPGGGVIGIHGTNQPEILPGRVSHGCVRVPNRNVARLRRLMPVGTPLRID